jgi:hypothetical protein
MNPDDRANLVYYKIANQQLEAKRGIMVVIAITRKRLRYVSRKVHLLLLDRAV